jgi:hypothetical protein
MALMLFVTGFAIAGGVLATYSYDVDAPPVSRLFTGTLTGLLAFALIGLGLGLVGGPGLATVVIASVVTALPLAGLVRADVRVRVRADVTSVWRALGVAARHPTPGLFACVVGAVAVGVALWLVFDHVVIENVEFAGARVPDRNGAGIRQEGNGLVVSHCFFHDNENGVMGGANPSSDIVIEGSEFARNGRGDGLTHNLYIGAVRSLRVERSYLHHALVGHNLKSRALETTVVSLEKMIGRFSAL